MRKISVGNVTRISKANARKLFAEGKPVYCAACNMNPVFPYGTVHRLDYAQPLEPGYEKEPISFDRIVNIFEYYNCNNETGRYDAFYTAS